ncbi:MAG: GatB/YqeY domain-containing protein [Chloroflexi bacterium]|nr:GatB/YqeY domain-containing protein [Chloroflexota bacterium]
MPSLFDCLNADLKEAMRAGQTTRRDEIRGLIAMLKAERQAKLTRTLQKHGLLPQGDVELTPEQQAQANQLRESTDLTDEEQQAVLLQRVKQHRQSIEGFLKGKRQDLVDIEEAQLAVDQAYLPQQLDEAAIEEAVQSAIQESGAQGPRDQGKVMGLLTGRLRGRADMRAVAARVQSILSQKQAGVH